MAAGATVPGASTRPAILAHALAPIGAWTILVAALGRDPGLLVLASILALGDTAFFALLVQAAPRVVRADAGRLHLVAAGCGAGTSLLVLLPWVLLGTAEAAVLGGAAAVLGPFGSAIAIDKAVAWGFLRAESSAVQCPSCGYDLQGRPDAPVCPECGGHLREEAGGLWASGGRGLRR